MPGTPRQRVTARERARLEAAQRARDRAAARNAFWDQLTRQTATLTALAHQARPTGDHAAVPGEAYQYLAAIYALQNLMTEVAALAEHLQHAWDAAARPLTGKGGDVIA